MEKHPLISTSSSQSPSTLLSSALRESESLFKYGPDPEITLPRTQLQGLDGHLSPPLGQGDEDELKSQGPPKSDYDRLQDGYAFSLRPLLVYIPVTMATVKECFRKLGSCLFALFDLLLGLPSVEVVELDKKIFDERTRYLVAELRVGADGPSMGRGGSGRSLLHPLGRFIQTQLERCGKERIFCLDSVRPPQIPVRFLSAGGVEVGLELWDRRLFSSLNGPLSALLTRVNASVDSWFLQERERIVQELGPDVTHEFLANKLMTEEYLRRLGEEIYSCPDFSGGVARLLVEQVELWAVLRFSLDYTHTHTLPIHTSSQLDSLKRLHPLLSRDGVWLERKKKEIEATFLSQNKFSPHETAIEDCKRRGLSQGAYFLQRDLYFCRETAPILEKELSAQKTPCRTYSWRVCWKAEPVFTSTTSHPLHRLLTCAHRYVTSILTLLFYCILEIPLNSPLSFRVLYERNHGNASQRDNQSFSTRCRDNPSRFSWQQEALHRAHRTIPACVHSTWRRVSKERSRHEEGLAKKAVSWQRVKNVVNIVIWYSFGFAMTIFWVVGFGSVVLVVNLLCLVAVLTCVVWPLFYSVGYHLFCILIRDLDGYHDNAWFPLVRILFDIIINFGEIVTGSVVILLCPLASLGVVLVTMATYAFHTGLSHLQNSTHSPIPPKCTTPKIYPLSPTTALALLLARLERLELSHFHRKALADLSVPIATYETWFDENLSQFSCSLNEGIPGFYRDLVRETVQLREKLETAVAERGRSLGTGLCGARGKVRILGWEDFVRRGVAMVTSIGGRLAETYGSGLGPHFAGREWEELFLTLVVEVFGEQVLYKEEESGVEQFAPILGGATAILPNYPVVAVSRSFSLTPSDYRVHPPFLSVGVFSPVCGRGPEGLGGDLLMNPLPILHPVGVSLLILARENDFSLDLSSPAVQAVVRVLEQATPLGRECLELDGAGDGSESEEDVRVESSYLGTSV